MSTSPSTSPTPEAAGPWERLERLIGAAGVARLQRAHVMVVGLGGVGSWAVEALARSGVGRLTIVDHDRVCITNINRQLPATLRTIGQFKTGCMAQRIKQINRACVVNAVPKRFDDHTADDILNLQPHVVIDAIDSVPEKALLLALCREYKIPVVCSCGAGGRRDPTQIRVADLAKVQGDALARAVRQTLRRAHNLTAHDGVLGIPAVYSTEPICMPVRDSAADPEAHQPGGLKPGTLCHVTGAFGFCCAAVALDALLA